MTASLAQLRSRRAFLTKAIVAGATAMGACTATRPLRAATGLLLPTHYADAATAAAFWAKPRVLNLYRPSTGEHQRLCYWQDGGLDRSGYLGICRLLRDAKAERAVTIDLRLLNLLRGMTGWLETVYGLSEPYQINSGYRTVTTNAMTEGAARNSFHIRGMAVDGRMPGLPEAYLGRLFAAFQGGGVGFYLNQQHFIHTDVGRVRFWIR
ncbi:MAG: YcbK family protein [Rhodanobacter sp.]